MVVAAAVMLKAHRYKDHVPCTVLTLQCSLLFDFSNSEVEINIILV